MNYAYFDAPSTGECTEYELIIGSNPGLYVGDFEFGFCSGEDKVLSFFCKQGKIYDNDNNFAYSFNQSKSEVFELYGNIFEEYHNYSIDRVPVNLDCSKSFGKFIDRFYFSDTGISFGLKVFGEADIVSLY